MEKEPEKPGKDHRVLKGKEITTSIMENGDALKALRESEERYRTAIESSNDGVAIVDGTRHVFVNQKCVEIFGYDCAEDIYKLPAPGFVHPDEIEHVREMLLKRQSGEITNSKYEFMGIKKNGETVDIEVSANRTFYLGRPVSLVYFRDITERKQLEKRFLQAQKMEAIGTLAGGIAHDFNNLLMGIQGRISLILMDTNPSHPHHNHLRLMEDCIQNAKDLTKQLLGFARGGKYEVKPTDLNELVEETLNIFGRAKKEIRIHPRLSEGLWTAKVDRGQISQVLLNIYVNAWQAMPEGGELYIETQNTELDEKYIKPFTVIPGSYIKISITDTGEGMDKTTQDRLFEPFFTTKGIGRGTGLGMAAAYGIIKNHNGIINVYSELGHGSTLVIYLPASPDIVPEKIIESQQIYEGKETILLVDDEEIVRDVSSQMMETLGYRVLVAGSGKEALELLRKNIKSIDLVILDLIMPDMGGAQTYDKLIELKPGLKVLASSGYGINEKAKELLDRGCNGFIQKPFNISELSRKMREVFAKKSVSQH